MDDFSKAIEKAEDNVPKYFFHRGIVSSILHNFEDAVGDFSIALNIKNDYCEAFLERGKCFFTAGDAEQAYEDFLQYMLLKP